MTILIHLALNACTANATTTPSSHSSTALTRIPYIFLREPSGGLAYLIRGGAQVGRGPSVLERLRKISSSALQALARHRDR